MKLVCKVPVLMAILAIAVAALAGCASDEPVEVEAALVDPTSAPTAIPTVVDVPTTVPLDAATVPTAEPTSIGFPPLPTLTPVPSPTVAAVELGDAASSDDPDDAELDDADNAEVEPTAEPKLTADAEPTIDPKPTAVPPTAVALTGAALEAAISNGGEVYQVTCTRCHSSQGEGTFQGPMLLAVANTYTQVTLEQELAYGHPVTFGFADKLSPEEISAVVAYVRATL